MVYILAGYRQLWQVNMNSIQSITARAVRVPFTIAPRSASGALAHASLVLIDVETSDGITGCAYVFAISDAMLTSLQHAVNGLATIVEGDRLAPLTLDEKLRASLRLLDTPGLVGLALAGLDMAFWDAHAKSCKLPLARLLGSDVESVQAYNSCGLWIQDVDALADEAEQLLASHNFGAIKLRLGRDDASLDLEAVRQVRKRIGDDKNLMVDFNQSQSVASALQRCLALDGEGLYWIEEPVRHNDFTGTAQVRSGINTALQTGENLCSTFELQSAINAGSADYYMPDVQRIGGVSGWLRAASVCQSAGVEMSSHLFPEVSVHLLAASPTRHWLEYVDWAAPILREPLVIKNGFAMVPDRPGLGISWDEEAVERYQV